MFSGPVDQDTPVLRHVPRTDENNWHTLDLPRGLLRAGDNTLAIEVHNSDPNSSDISLNVRVVARVG